MWTLQVSKIKWIFCNDVLTNIEQEWTLNQYKVFVKSMDTLLVECFKQFLFCF